MTTATRLFFILLITTSSTYSCISVKLSGTGGDAKRAAGVQYVEPGNGFVKEASPDVDMAWRQPTSGNVISYISDCQDITDPTLDSIVQGTMSGLNSLAIESSQTQMVQEREGRRVLASGKVDGVPSKVELLVFKRNSCIYILSYVGVEKAFTKNQTDFDKFTRGFRAP